MIFEKWWKNLSETELYLVRANVYLQKLINKGRKIEDYAKMGIPIKESFKWEGLINHSNTT